MKKIIAATALATTLALTGCGVKVNEQTMTCTVTGKESITTSEGHEYRVHTDECGTLVNSDAWGKFNSADIQGQLHEDETYIFTTWGYRNGFLSMFPNIIEADRVNE
jgi:hypothetical protein